MTEKVKLYAFIVQATTYGVPGWQKTTVMPASEDRLTEKIRQEAGCPDAEVVLVQREKWDSPAFDSVDQQELQRKFHLVLGSVVDYFRKEGITHPPINRLVEDGTVMQSPVSGKIIFIYKIH